jgi:hypothetical protein
MMKLAFKANDTYTSALGSVMANLATLETCLRVTLHYVKDRPTLPRDTFRKIEVGDSLPECWMTSGTH